MVAIIICTYNRSKNLFMCLESLFKQSYQKFRIIIVDASDDDETKKIVQRYDKAELIKITHIRSEKGLTLQRNKGVQSLSTKDEIVLFIDDDVELMEKYVEIVVMKYTDDYEHRIIGISGNAVNEKKRNYFDRTIRNIFLITDNYTGRILRSGDAGHIFSPQKDSDIAVLSGCNMSYRVSIFTKELMRFDEHLTGYAYMEDQDFSIRAGRFGKYVQLKDAKLVHHVSPISRNKYETLFEMYIVNSHYIFKKNFRTSRINYILYWWRIVGKLMHACALSIRTGDIGPIVGWCTGVSKIMKIS